MPGREWPSALPEGPFPPLQPRPLPVGQWGSGAGQGRISPGQSGEGPEPACAQAGHRGTTIRRGVGTCGALTAHPYFTQFLQRPHEVATRVPILEVRTVRHQKEKPHS